MTKPFPEHSEPSRTHWGLSVAIVVFCEVVAADRLPICLFRLPLNIIMLPMINCPHMVALWQNNLVRSSLRPSSFCIYSLSVWLTNIQWISECVWERESLGGSIDRRILPWWSERQRRPKTVGCCENVFSIIALFMRPFKFIGGKHPTQFWGRNLFFTFALALQDFQSKFESSIPNVILHGTRCACS